MEATRFLPLLGRILIGLPFLVSGLGKLAAFGPTTAYISSVGLPLAPLGWAIAVAFEVGGGLLLILGFRAREVASCKSRISAPDDLAWTREGRAIPGMSQGPPPRAPNIGQLPNGRGRFPR